MGIIKTAIMSGAAMYGVNKLAQTAQTRGNSQQSSRGQYDRDESYYNRDQSDRRESYYNRPVEYRENRSDSRGGAPRDSYSREQGPFRQNERGQRLLLEDDYVNQDQPYYWETNNRIQNQNQNQYDYAGQARSNSTPPQYNRFSQNTPRGFVEPEEDDVREPQRGGGRGDMMSGLAQQAMSMGLFSGGGDNRKSSGKGGDMLKNLIGK